MVIYLSINNLHLLAKQNKKTMATVPPTPRKRTRANLFQEPTVEDWLSAAGLSLLGEVNGLTVLSTPEDLLGFWATCPSTEWSVCYTGPNNDEGLPEHLQVESNYVVYQQAGL